MSATIKRGDIVRIKPGCQDPGDGRLLAQHTSGPWRVIENAHIDAIQVMAPSDGDRVCTVTSRSESAANGRLIAAAPELLAALQNILTANPDLAEVADEARTAIAKATGGGL